MKNLIKKILREQVSEKEIESGFEDFYKLFSQKYGKIENFEGIVQEIESDIKKSPTPKITIANRGNFCGMSHSDNVILQSTIFNYNIHKFIYVLFHEIAHQYQYKKYGKNLVYEMLHGEIDDELLDKLIKIEQVADRFGESMANKYATKFKFSKSPITSPYSNTNTEYAKKSYKNLFLKLQDEIKKGEIGCVEQMESRMLDFMTTNPVMSTPIYSGSSYGDYGSYYGRDYNSRYDDDYEKSYSKYEKGEINDNSDNIHDEYEIILQNLFYEIGSEINQIVSEAYDIYGIVGHNLVIDLINQEGFSKFHYNQKEEENGEESEDQDLLNKIDEDFYPIVEDLKKYVEESLHKIMDDVEKDYSFEGSEIIIDLIDETGFGDLWLNY